MPYSYRTLDSVGSGFDHFENLDHFKIIYNDSLIAQFSECTFFAIPLKPIFSKLYDFKCLGDECSITTTQIFRNVITYNIITKKSFKLSTLR
jgi:hypothetical protein